MFKRVLLCLIGTLFMSSINILNAEQNGNQDIPVLIENNINIGLNNINNIELVNNNEENNNENQILQTILQTSWESLLVRFDYSNQKIMEYVKSNEFLNLINECLKYSKKLKNFDPDDIRFSKISDIINCEAMEQKIEEHRSAVEHHNVPDTGIWNEIPILFQDGIHKDIQKTIENKMFSCFPNELKHYDISFSKDVNNNFCFQCIFPHEFVILPNHSVSEEELCLLTLSIKMDLLTNNTPKTNILLLAKYLLNIYTNSPDNIQQEINRYRAYLTNGENIMLNNSLRNYYRLYNNNDIRNFANYF